MKVSGKLIITLLVVTLLFLFTSCSAKPSPVAGTAGTQNASDLVLTLEELAKYNGQDGNPAYVAVDGIVYDVTKVPYWKGGKHNGFEAGKDLTDAIKNISPHGTAKLKGLPVVGKIKE
jgi:predicted heme/steroid binding protein